MTKVLVNRCFGGFGFSLAVFDWFKEHGYKTEILVDSSLDKKARKKTGVDSDTICYKYVSRKGEYSIISHQTYFNEVACVGKGKENYISSSDIRFRTWGILIKCVEELGIQKASSEMAELQIVDVPLPIEQLQIDEYDGSEQVEEIHQSW